MARRWTTKEEIEKRKELSRLYIGKNKTIGEISETLNIAESTVFDRMERLKIPSTPERKIHYLNRKRGALSFPNFSEKLAEFFGIMLGDGHIAFYESVGVYQVCVCINTTTDIEYISYVKNLMEDLFKVSVGCHHRKDKDVVDLFISSVDLLNYLKERGLYSVNKVRDQAGVPKWIFEKKSYQKSFLRGFFDTDGSIYSLKFGTQMGFCNKSIPLINSTRELLLNLGYHPSIVSSFKVYLTRKPDLYKYSQEIGFGNSKHTKRAKKFGII